MRRWWQNLVGWWTWRQDRQQRLLSLRAIRRTKAPHFRRAQWLIYDIVRLLEQRPRKFLPA